MRQAYTPEGQFSMPKFQIALRPLWPVTTTKISIAAEYIDDELSIEPSFDV